MSEIVQQVEAQRGMVVVAHPDDAEFSSGGTIAAWVDVGIEVVLVIATDGSKGSADVEMSSDHLIRTRREEQQAAAAVLGVHEVVFLGYPDGYLEHTLDLRKDIARVIRQYRPDRLITMAPYRSFTVNSYINHPDHLAVGDATLAAVYPTARDRLTFPDLAAAGLEPHKVREVYVTGAEQPDCWINIEATVARKIEALRKHVSQIADMDAMEERVRARAAEVAQGHEIPYAECFKVFYLS
ncbi:MAG TPA: PIG-L family deacetylase [Herpetosiphonaceae bacterium]|nr:PIG-L family deacetylase [Herpetosiphonaceae bacterium]